jgi:chromosome segregation ATPase
MDSIQISKLTTELNESKAKIGEYNKKISQLNDLIKSYESNLHTTDEEMRKLKVS